MPRDMFGLAYSVRMQAGKSDTAEVSLYGKIISDMPEEWKLSKEDKSAANFDRDIKAVREKGATKLFLRINSPGGVCTEAVAMRAILANAGFEEINIRIEGLCASAATTVATLPGAHVAITEGSEYMIHNPWLVMAGNADDLEHAVERLRNIEQTSRQFYVAKTGQSEEQIKAWMDAETWFTAEQAVEHGFADELLKAEPDEAPAVACVTGPQLALMRAMYKAVPDNVREVAIDDGCDCIEIRHGEPEPGEPSEINTLQEVDTMDIKDLTMEELREGNPALFEQVKQEAVETERARLADIDALTIPGYESMADEAKSNGTSALDFQKQIVAAMKKKGADFMAARAAETAPAQEVKGSEPETGKTEEQEAKEAAQAVADFAKAYTGSAADGMF